MGALLERDVEAGHLTALLQVARGGAGRGVVVEGPAGIGKTELLRRAAEEARRLGFEVLVGRGGELERELAFGVVRQLFERVVMRRGQDDPLPHHVSSAAAQALGFPGDGGWMRQLPQEEEFSILHGVYWLCAHLAEEQPLVVVVDDAHWADAASLRWLAYLLRRIEPLSILVVIGVRTGERAPDAELVAALTAEPAVSVLRPRPLSETAVTQLVHREFGEAAEEEFCRACHTAAGGNPFLSQELLTAIRADGLAPTAAEAPRVLEIGPEAIARSLLLRLARLDPAARAVARAVAVLGTGAELRHAAALARLSAEEAALAADVLVDAGLLRPGRPLEYAHPVLRSVVYADIPDGERANAHRAAARVFLDEPDATRRAAMHLLSADAAGEAWVVDALLAAARADAIPEQALVYLRRALREPPSRETLGPVLVALGEAEAAAFAAPADLVDRFTAAARAAGDDLVLRARARLGLTTALLLAGRPGEAATVASDTAGELRGGAGDEARELLPRLEGAWLNARGLLGEPLTEARAAELLELAGAGQSGGDRALLANLAYDGVFAGWDRARVVDVARRALDGQRLLDDRLYYDHYVAVWALEFADELDEALVACSAAIDCARDRASVGEYAYAHTVRALVHNRRGALREAEADARTTLELVDEHGLDPGMLALTRAALLDVLVSRGAAEEAGRVAAAEPLAEVATPVTGYFLHARGRLHRLLGEEPEALEDFRAAGLILREKGTDHPGFCAWRSSAALASLALGDADQARCLADEELAAAAAWGGRARAVALRCRAMVDGDLERLREAAGLLEASPARLERAAALLELGAALRRGKERVASREPLRQALELAHVCDAAPLAARAQEELAATGARPRRVMLTGAESLTASERRVARMAAEGMTNRQIAQALFVSLPTVEKHLGQAYRKLDISSRQELPEALGGQATPA